jgi:hypothetical protein
VRTGRWLQGPRWPFPGWQCAAAAGCALLLLSGCGNWISGEQTGAVAVRLSPPHSVEVLLNRCSSVVDEVLLFGPYRGPRTKPDIPIGVWRASTPFHHDTVLNIDHPGPAWKVRRDPGQLDPGTTYAVEAGYTGDDDQGLSDANFTLAQLDALRPGEVRLYGRVMQQSKFARSDWCFEY